LEVEELRILRAEARDSSIKINSLSVDASRFKDASIKAEGRLLELEELLREKGKEAEENERRWRQLALKHSMDKLEKKKKGGQHGEGLLPGDQDLDFKILEAACEEATQKTENTCAEMVSKAEEACRERIEETMAWCAEEEARYEADRPRQRGMIRPSTGGRSPGPGRQHRAKSLSGTSDEHVVVSADAVVDSNVEAMWARYTNPLQSRSPHDPRYTNPHAAGSKKERRGMSRDRTRKRHDATTATHDPLRSRSPHDPIQSRSPHDPIQSRSPHDPLRSRSTSQAAERLRKDLLKSMRDPERGAALNPKPRPHRVRSPPRAYSSGVDGPYVDAIRRRSPPRSPLDASSISLEREASPLKVMHSRVRVRRERGIPSKGDAL